MDKLKQSMRDLDKQIIALINERFAQAKQGTEDGLPVPDLTATDLERSALLELLPLNHGPMKPVTLQAIYREILSGQFDLVRPVKVAFFGSEGTFTHQATLAKFGESVDTISRRTVPDIFDDVAKGHVDYGVVPIENSTEGAVTATFDLFADTSVQIYSEIYVRIHHNLMAKCRREQLTVVYSHPQVFGQCRRWLQQNLAGVELVEVANTTAAAQRAAVEENAGAMGSALAAEKYGLHILDANVEDFAENITRFLVLSKHAPERTGDDKTSLMFAIQDQVGALYDSLLPFKNSGVNLAMIQSRPSKQKIWDYLFYVDCIGDADCPQLQAAIEELKANSKFVKVLGTYPRSPDPV